MAIVFQKPKSLTDAALHYCPGPVGSGKIFILKRSRHLFPVAVQSHPSCQSSKVKEKDIEDLGMHGRPF